MDRRIDLDRARRDAKALLRAARAGESEAIDRLRSDREPRLADAQRAVARELGEPSWPALVRRVEAEVAGGVDELLDAVFASEHQAALALAGARPQVAERLRTNSALALIRAAREGRADAVYTLLELGVDANVCDPASGGTALHVAAQLGWLDVVDVLVGWMPLDRHARDAGGATALGACVEGSVRALRESRRAGDAHLVIAKVLVSNGLRAEAGMVEHASDELAGWLQEQLADRTAASELAEELGETAWAGDVGMFGYLSGSPVAEVRRVGDGFAFRTGLLDNTRNGVVCSRLAAETADECIAELLAWLAEHHAPAQWMVTAETDPPDLRERLQRAGCRPERTAVYMAAGLTGRDLSDRRLAAGVEITPIRDAAQLAEAFAAASKLNDDPQQREHELALFASLGLADDRALQHYAARLHGRVVGSASAFAASATLTLADLGVATHARRSGIGRALVLHALREGKRAGCSLVVLAPTPATVPFYEALEFTLGRFPPNRSFYTPLP